MMKGADGRLAKWTRSCLSKSYPSGLNYNSYANRFFTPKGKQFQRNGWVTVGWHCMHRSVHSSTNIVWMKLFPSCSQSRRNSDFFFRCLADSLNQKPSTNALQTKRGTKAKQNREMNSDEGSITVHGVLFCCCVTDPRLVSSTLSKPLNQFSKWDWIKSNYCSMTIDRINGIICAIHSTHEQTKLRTQHCSTLWRQQRLFCSGCPSLADLDPDFVFFKQVLLHFSCSSCFFQGDFLK